MCDPRPHDPWPNHRVASGASLAVTIAAYQAIGGLPPRPVGEDQALQGFEPGRLQGSSRHGGGRYHLVPVRRPGAGGAADTMRHRHAVPDAPCDEDIEPALDFTRRAMCRRRLRRTGTSRAAELPALLAPTRDFQGAGGFDRNGGDRCLRGLLGPGVPGKSGPGRAPSIAAIKSAAADRDGRPDPASSAADTAGPKIAPADKSPS